MEPNPRNLSGQVQLLARVHRSTTQTIATATNTAVVFDTPLDNLGGMWNPNQGDRVTVPVRGVYSLGGASSWVANAAGIRYQWFRRNGNDLKAFGPQAALPGSAVINDLEAGAKIILEAGEYVELIVHQTSGGNLNLNTSPRFYPLFFVFLETLLG